MKWPLSRTASRLAGVVVLALAGMGWAIKVGDVDTRVYRIGWEHDPPFQQRAEDGSPAGLTVDLVREAARRKNVKLEWVFRPSSSEDSLRRGLVDLWPLITILPERRTFIHFTEPYLQPEHYMIVPANGPFKRLEDLGEARISHLRVPVIQRLAREILPRAQLFPRETASAALEDVCRGDSDAVFVEEFRGFAIFVNGTPCSSQPYRLIWLPQVLTNLAVGSTFEAAGAANRIRDGIGEVAQEGALAAIMTKWGYFSPRNLQNMTALINSKRRERFLGAAAAFWAALFGVAIFGADRIRRQKNRIKTLQAEAARRASEDRFRNLANTAPVMVWISGVDKLVTFVNETFRAFTGRTAEQELGNGWAQCVHEDDLEACVARYHEAFDARRSFQIEYRLRRADGEYRYVLDSAAPIFENGEFAGYVGSCVDITDLKRAQEENAARQKFESVGRLAGGIAHDFNNLLGGVLAHADVAVDELAQGSRPDEELQKIRAAAIRGAEIVRQLMIYAGKENAALELVDVSRIVHEMLDLLKVSISKHATLHTNLDPELPAIRANSAQIRQVVMNLVTNASEAIGEQDGVINVTTSQVRIGEESGAGEAENLAKGDYVRIEVSDTGCGMTPEAQRRIFDPFFTTKFTGRGLGLAFVQGILRAHGGAMNLRSAPGKGATFEILLPCTNDRIQATQSIMTGSEKTPAVSGTVLVVEDEGSLRLAVSKMLRKSGFTVIEASDGFFAMDLIETHRKSLDVILLDVTLPGKPSREVFEEARRILPDVKVIVTSAYGQGFVDAAFPGLRGDQFLRKPYLLSDLVRLLRETLA